MWFWYDVGPQHMLPSLHWHVDDSEFAAPVQSTASDVKTSPALRSTLTHSRLGNAVCLQGLSLDPSFQTGRSDMVRVFVM